MLDLIVIGSGPGGFRAAMLAAQGGLRVALVERDDWGGACLNRGCVPKKAWYRTARLAAAAPGFARRGLSGSLAPDFPAAWRYQREVVSTVRASYVAWLDRLGVRRVEGAARFVDPRRVRIEGKRDGETIAARHTIIATGSRPQRPPWLRAGGTKVLDTDALFERPPPEGGRVALLGSGAVGTEMAFILGQLGIELVWLTGQAPLSSMAFSAPAKKRLGEALAAQGVAARTGSRPLACRVAGDAITLELPGNTQLEVDWVLAGTGRVPNTDSLDLAAAGVRVDARGFVAVDAAQRTSVEGVYAIGDCANPAMSANHALADAGVAINSIVSPRAAPGPRPWVPEVIYSALELARVGATEDALEAGEIEYATGFSSFEASPAALADDAADGYVRLLAASEGGALLGCEIVGAEAGELIQLAAPGMPGEALLARLARAGVAHPSLGETFADAAESLISGWGFRRGGAGAA